MKFDEREAKEFLWECCGERRPQKNEAKAAVQTLAGGKRSPRPQGTSEASE